ncbi:MAG: prephenate dehydrogenase/arogenate dehydrogenase family protein [Chloroflexi bacterium]|nr:prephenate dehydrogenase/arogenate dehydrogenase family protein [Chloroflexota bacterium]
MSKITIIGLGLIGTSIGLALKHKDSEFEIMGHDRKNDAVVQARKLNAIDKSHWNLISACEEADLILLAIPAAGIPPTLEAIKQDLKPGCLIMDTAPIMRQPLAAAATLPGNVYYISSNPILPAERNQPSADLFTEISWVLSPTPDTDPSVIQVASDIITALGAQPFFLDPDEHDGLMAVVEGIPMILAATLLNATGSSSAWREIRRIAGSQFETTSYLPDFLPEELAQPLLPNSANLSHWLDILIAELENWKSDLQDKNEDALKARFEKAIDLRTQWLNIRSKNRWEAPDRIEDTPSFWRRLMGMRRRSPRRSS